MNVHKRTNEHTYERTSHEHTIHIWQPVVVDRYGQIQRMAGCILYMLYSFINKPISGVIVSAASYSQLQGKVGPWLQSASDEIGIIGAR